MATTNGVSIGSTKEEDWEQLAAEYSRIAYHTSIKPIGKMLERANTFLPFSQATSILDNGCGPGPVMKRIIADHGSEIPKDCPLLCCDFSEAMLKQVQQQKAANERDPHWSRLEIKQQNAMDLNEVADASQSHVTAGMVYFLTADSMKCLTESRRVLKDGGVLSLSSWEGSQWQDLMKIVGTVRPDKQLPHIPDNWTSTAGIRSEMEEAGFRDVETYRVPCEMPFQSHGFLVHFMLTKMPHMIALTKDMSEAEIKKVEQAMVEECKRMEPGVPGELKGVALVGVGRK